MNYLSLYGKKVLHGKFKVVMKILITGGFGFVGGRLAEYLSLAGHTIILGSRKASEAPIWLPNVKVQKIDWDDEASLIRSCQGVDMVIQAAGMNANDCSSDPEAALNFNGKSTGRLAKAALKSDVTRFIYLSTAHVYSNPLTGHITEENVPRNTHPYATSHLAGENAVLNLKQSKKMWRIVLRLSNAFGSPKDLKTNCWMLLINDLCKQAVEKRKLVLKSNGLQSRDFISLEQVSNVVAFFANRSIKPNGLNIFNLGTGISKSVFEIAKLVQLRCKLVLDFEPELLCLSSDKNEPQTPLIYKSTNLPLLGIKVDDSYNLTEIDNLLCYCRKHFC